MIKDIDVIFSSYDEYESMPVVNIKLGTISSEQVLQLQDKIKTAQYYLGPCIFDMCAKYTDVVNRRDILSHSSRRRKYEISDLFFGRAGFIPPCAGRKKPKTDEDLTCMCARNLRHGRCRNELMIQTLCLTLFKDKYSKENQK